MRTKLRKPGATLIEILTYMALASVVFLAIYGIFAAGRRYFEIARASIEVQQAANTIAFERDPRLKETLFRLFSTNHSPEAQAGCLSELLCCLPRVEAPAELSYENVFRVLIVQFMDAANLDLRALKKSCVHIVQPDGRLIPFEAFNLFYRCDSEIK